MVDITVEDGSIVDDANSYVSVDDATAYALDRGITLTGDVGIMLIKSMDYLIQFRGRWKGSRVESTQPLDWPRKCVYLYDVLIADTLIPQELVYAQDQLVMAIFSGIDLLPTQQGGAGSLPVIKDKVGPIETTYASPIDLAGWDWADIKLPAVDALLAPLIDGAPWRLRTERI